MESFEFMSAIAIMFILFCICFYFYRKEFKKGYAWLSFRRYFTIFPFLGVMILIPILIVGILSLIMEDFEFFGLLFEIDFDSKGGENYFDSMPSSIKWFDAFFIITCMLFSIYGLLKFFAFLIIMISMMT